MANKYIAQQLTGALAEVEFLQTTAGLADAGKGIGTNAQGVLDATLLPAGVGLDVLSVVSSEALTAGRLVHLWNDGGTLKVRHASAAGPGYLVANGFILDTVAVDTPVNVYKNSGANNTGVTGLTPGSVYYLDKTVPGGVILDPSAFVAGDIIQRVGLSYLATGLSFEIHQPVVKA